MAFHPSSVIKVPGTHPQFALGTSVPDYLGSLADKHGAL
jgi:hypothetical protein